MSAATWPRPDRAPGSGRTPAGFTPGWPTLALAAVGYLAAVLVATYPQVQYLATRFPGSSTDPMQHLWVMRWYRTCLLSGRAPWVCPDLQAPIGAPLGGFSPLQLQSLLFVPLSLVSGNDVLCYNLVWLAAFVFTGLGVLILAWNVVGHRPAAGLAGLAAMLSTPLMMRSLCHLELMCVGSVALFLAGWLRWLERPSRRGLLACVALAGLVTMSAVYFIVYTVFPAALLFGFELVRGTRAEGPGWLRARGRGLLAFGLLGLAVQGALLSPQLWNRWQGGTTARPRAEFQTPAVPPWGYVVPASSQRLHRLWAADAYEAQGYPAFTGCAYPGVVVLTLLGVTAVGRVRFPRAGAWWAALALMMLLSAGSHWRLGTWRVPMPAWWLWHVLPPLRQTRDPARFALVAVCLAAVVAAAGYRAGSARLPRRWQRAGLLGLAATLVVVDLSPVPYGLHFSLPPVPPAYAWIAARTPGARLLEAPVPDSSADNLQSATATYWQSQHGLTTSAGYSGFANVRFDDQIAHVSPLGAVEVGRLDPATDPEHARIGLLHDSSVRDVLWLHLTHHRFDYVVWHHWARGPYDRPANQVAVLRLMAPASVFADAGTEVFATAKLAPPVRPVLIPTAGWRTTSAIPRPLAAVEPRAGLILHAPEAAGPVVLALEARGFGADRTAVLREGDRTLARWLIRADRPQTYRTPPLHLTPGPHPLVLESDGATAPRREDQQVPRGHPGPISLLATRLQLEPPDSSPIPAASADPPDEGEIHAGCPGVP